MAATVEGRELSRQHRQAQLRVSAATIRRFVALWPIWQGDEESFARMVAASVPLIQVQHRTSSGLASGYYRAFRQAELAAGAATPTLAAFDTADVVSSMYHTGLRQTERSLAAGMDAAAARQQALTRVSGTVSRHTLNGGRDTIVGSVDADPQAVGWQRVTAVKPCAFCVMLSSRGPAYRRQETAGFQAHDHCACTAEPAYGRGRDFWNPQNVEHRDLYRQVAVGSASPVNAIRRALAGT